MPKIGANWTGIEPGDIISFKYQSVVDKSKSARTSSILVLNNRFQKKLKSGETGYYLNGLKLEGSNITVFNNKDDAWALLSEIGWVSIRSLKNEIYKVDIEGKYIGSYGANQKLYKMIQKHHKEKRHNLEHMIGIKLKKVLFFMNQLNYQKIK